MAGLVYAVIVQTGPFLLEEGGADRPKQPDTHNFPLVGIVALKTRQLAGVAIAGEIGDADLVLQDRGAPSEIGENCASD